MAQFGNIIKICIVCKKRYNAIKRKGIWRRQKYCSALCRYKNFRKNNLKKIQHYNYLRWVEFKKQNHLFCKYCNKKINIKDRKSGRTLHEQCTILQHKLIRKKYIDKIQIAFNNFKKKKGCKVCGYNKFGCSLDFHHNNPKNKERRITAHLWWSNLKLFKKEIKKCTLLCKNCHYGVHHKK